MQQSQPVEKNLVVPIRKRLSICTENKEIYGL